MTNINAVEKMAELMQQMEESSPRVAALQYCLTQLEARCAALAAELSSVLTDRAVILEDLDNTCFEIGMQRGEKAEAYPTPVVANHDAFLAEVRAQGVDVAIEHLINKFEGTGRIGVPVMALEWLSKELRKGVQS
ncbi:hypothetical protein P832_02001 [Enterobacter kobei]|uniref:hypothetical protein n=1 Tax=Enterobacter kobei TaxID=208224 RepID=UPI00044A6416|nr:hypothetical protein [Enterobacter kobei]EUL86724.1 hypothetical protein P827_01224 [Enterobacter kobei]KDF73758.1 hypothetical protein P832_02001 [Enterobacter kobei]